MIEPVIVITDTCVAGGKLVITDETVVCETGTPTPPGKTPTNFSVIHKDGSRWWGIRIIFWIGNRVRVAFPDDTDLDKATCGAVRQGAVIDNQVLPVDLPDGRSNTNPPACVGPSDDVTDGPDLKDGTVVRDDAGTPTDPGDDRSVVRLCFDEALGTLINPEGFGLSGYNSAVRTASVAAALDPDDPACVKAFFPDGTDVSRATLVTVTDAVVFDPDGHPQPGGVPAPVRHHPRPPPGRHHRAQPALGRSRPGHGHRGLHLRRHRHGQPRRPLRLRGRPG